MKQQFKRQTGKVLSLTYIVASGRLSRFSFHFVYSSIVYEWLNVVMQFTYAIEFY